MAAFLGGVLRLSRNTWRSRFGEPYVKKRVARNDSEYFYQLRQKKKAQKAMTEGDPVAPGGFRPENQITMKQSRMKERYGKRMNQK